MKNKLSPYKHVILTHMDFDGIASLINVYNIIDNPEKNFMYYAVGYHSIDKTLAKIKKDTFDILWILDLNLTREQVDIIKTFSGYKKIIWIDHHHYEYDVRECIREKKDFECVFIHDETISACLATNQFIAFNWPEAQKKCEEFCILGDVYDMWRRNHPKWKEAYAINDLFWEYKYEKFFKTFKDGYVLNTEDKAMIKQIHTERLEYEMDTIKNYIQHNVEYDIAYIFNPACKHINHITLTIVAKFYVILKEIREKSIAYSIRLYDPDFLLTLQEVFAIVKEKGILINTSGGHAKIGGIEIPIEENQKFLETINLIFERKLK